MQPFLNFYKSFSCFSSYSSTVRNKANSIVADSVETDSIETDSKETTIEETDYNGNKKPRATQPTAYLTPAQENDTK